MYDLFELDTKLPSYACFKMLKSDTDHLSKIQLNVNESSKTKSPSNHTLTHDNSHNTTVHRGRRSANQIIKT